MVAVLQYIPEDDYCHVEPVRTPLRALPEVRAVPEVRALPEVPQVQEVLRRPTSPRVTRSQRRAVYWRRRLVAAALGLGVLLAAVHAGAALGGTTTTASERSPHVKSVIVQPGDTLWSIAHRLAPAADTRDVVDALAAQRGGSDLQVGDVVRWPR